MYVRAEDEIYFCLYYISLFTMFNFKVSIYTRDSNSNNSNNSNNIRLRFMYEMYV